MEHRMKEMMNQIEVPDGLREELLKIPNQNTDTEDKRKWIELGRIGRVAAVVLGIAALGSGTVYAARNILGIRDFAHTLPEEAEQYINTEVTVSDVVQNISADEENVTSDLVTFRVKETVADTSNCLVVVEATLQDPEHYLILWEADEYPYLVESESFPASNLYEDALEHESLAEYAERVNKELLGIDIGSPWGELDFQGDYWVDSVDCRQEDAAHTVFFLNCSAHQAYSDQTISVDPILYITNVVRTYTIEDNYYTFEECMNETMTIELDNVALSEERAVYEFSDKADMRVENSSILVQKVTLINTELETKYIMDVVNEDTEWGDMIGWALVDDNGDFLQSGTTSVGSGGMPDDQGALRLQGTVQKMVLPDHVNVWFSNSWTGEEYILWNIPVAKAE